MYPSGKQQKIPLEERLHEMIEMITALAALDFSHKATVQGTEDLIDVLSIGLNMLSEALEETVVSKSRLIENERMFKALFSNASDAIVMVKGEWIVDCNQQACSILQATPGEIIGKHVLDFVTLQASERKAYHSLLTKIVRDVKQDRMDTFEFTIYDLTEKAIEVEVGISAFRMNDIHYYWVIFRDLTEKKLVQSVIRKNNEQLQAIIENSPISMVLTNAYGEIIMCNKATCQLLGYSSQELKGRNLQTITYPDDRHLTDKPLQDLAKGKINHYYQENRYIRKDGTIIKAFVSLSALEFWQGEMVFLAQAIDLTEIKEKEIALQENMRHLKRINEELDQFAYVVSHDLKAPLRGISNIATFLEEDLSGIEDPKIFQHIKLIKGRVARMNNLIEGLLEYSRIGRKEEKREIVSLETTIRDSLTMMAPPDSLELVLPENLPSIYCNRLGLQQVFQNLFSNALKHTDSDQPRIEVRYKELMENHQLEVIDNGPGIHPKHQATIFKIFSTLESKDRRENTGVGLSIVKKWVENMGGKIWVESSPGKGSNFIFTLPKQQLAQ